jgi:hypothetical protein
VKRANGSIRNLQYEDALTSQCHLHESTSLNEHTF